MKIPREIDINEIPFPTLESLVEQVIELGDQKTTNSPSSELKHLPADITKALVAISTNAWRLAGKTMDIDGEAKVEIGKDDARKIVRYIESLCQALKDIGIEIKDRTGEVFDYGLPEKVVTSQPQEGVTKERVLETLRPTIYFRGQIAQQGEIIIATPMNEHLSAGKENLSTEDSNKESKTSQLSKSETSEAEEQLTKAESTLVANESKEPTSEEKIESIQPAAEDSTPSIKDNSNEAKD